MAPAFHQPSDHLVQYAVNAARLSPCRSKRGVVIFDGQAAIAHGYNDKPVGFHCDGSDACKATCRREAVHAEQVALFLAGRDVSGCELLHVKVVDGTLVPSPGPSCVECSKLVLATGIVHVWLYHEDGWRRYDAAEFHRLSLQSASVADEHLKSLVGRLRERADIESCNAAPADDEAAVVFQDDLPEVTWHEMREIVALLREAADAIEAGK